MNMTPGNTKVAYAVLHVDDDIEFCGAVKFRLSKANYDVTSAESGKEALKLVGTKKFNIAILDVSLPDINGYQLAKKIRDMVPGLPIVILTGLRDDNNIMMSLDLDCQSLIEKPVTFDMLEFNIQRLLSSPKYSDAAR